MKTVRKPNFLFIGPDKSGSSWMFEILRQHPQVFVPPAKDIYFFDRYYDKGLDWYFAHFKPADEHHLRVGELSHDYMYSDEAAERIARDIQDVHLITCLRDPAERSFSQYLYLTRSGEVEGSFEEAVIKFPKIIENSLYAPCINRYLSRFDAAQLQILFFDDLQKDPEEFAKSLFSYLDLPFIPDLPYHVRVREAGKARNKYLSRALKFGAETARRMGFSNLVGRIKHGIVGQVAYQNFEKGEKPKLSPEQRRQLIDRYFRKDIELVEQLTQRDLSHWKE